MNEGLVIHTYMKYKNQLRYSLKNKILTLKFLSTLETNP